MSKKVWLIIYSILIVAILVLAFFLLKDQIFKKTVFELIGESTINHNLNDEYHDAGFIAKNGKDDVSNEVIVDDNIDVTKEGTYTITYRYKENVLNRTVIVKKLDSFNLLGDKDIYILINGQYDDPKVDVFENGIDYSKDVIINSNVDYSKAGDYTITYSFNHTDKTLERNIHVSDYSEFFKIEYDSEKVVDNLNVQLIMDQNKVSKYILPNKVERTVDGLYTINKNGEYTFTVYDKYNNKYDRVINIKNIRVIEPLTGTCNATIDSGKTTITVKSNKEVIKYSYNGVESKDNPYTVNQEIKDNSVTIYDNYNQSKEIKCETKETLGTMKIHFINAGGYYDDAILIQTNKATIWIDGGRGKERIIPYLRSKNVTTIDYIIGSHTEYDHIDAEGEIIRNFDVKNVIYANSIYSCGCRCESKDVKSVLSALNSKNMKASVQSVPSKLDIGNMTLYFIGPSKLTCNKNNNSFIFILKFGNNTFMFTGDSDSPLKDVNTLTTNAKALGLSNINVDVVKYPHHGNEWLSDNFINAANAKYYVVPNMNCANVPNNSFRNAMKNKGVPVYRQSDSKTGNILITSDGTNITFTMDVS